MKGYYNHLTRLEMESVDKENTIILIPLGATEQHGNQAPLGTDTLIAEEMSRRVLNKLDDSFPLLVFPVIPVGLSSEHQKFCGSVTFKPTTYYHILYDICAGLAHHGFKKIAFLVCHGGNSPAATMVAREIRCDYEGTDVFVISSGAFDDPRVKATISKDNTFDFHGGEMETSMVMAIDESLVKLETSETGLMKTNTFALHMPWVGDDFVTPEGKPIGIGGDPRGSTKEKGDIIFDVSADEIIHTLNTINAYHR